MDYSIGFAEIFAFIVLGAMSFGFGYVVGNTQGMESATEILHNKNIEYMKKSGNCPYELSNQLAVDYIVDKEEE